MSNALDHIRIKGFKSIRELDIELRPLNVLIGANGAGKSNFVSFFRFIQEMAVTKLELAVAKHGGADAILHFGAKVTRQLDAEFHFQNNAYSVRFVPVAENKLFNVENKPFNVEDKLFIAEEKAAYTTHIGTHAPPPEAVRHSFEEPISSSEPRHRESELLKKGRVYYQLKRADMPAQRVFEFISNWVVYHFSDTSEYAGMRQQKAINDNEFLRQDAENLAAFLFMLQKTSPAAYEQIRDAVRLAAPFFDDFKLRPVTANPELIQLEWTQVGSDYPFRPSQFSDGTLRFICLATALLQPNPPATMLFDEPELGLHPYALTLLASLFKRAAKSGGQVIACTQSASLLNEFEPEDVIVVDRRDGQSTFHRLDKAELSEWLEDYGLGELWQKNIFGGRPHGEAGNGPPKSDAVAPGNAPPEGDIP